MNLRNLPARLGTSLVAVVGIGGVVAVLVSLLSMGEGFRAALDLSGRTTSALVLRGGSPDELSSAFGREEVNVIASAPGIARDALGPMASPEFYTIVDLPMRSTGTGANVPFRGVTSRAVERPRRLPHRCRPDVRARQGRGDRRPRRVRAVRQRGPRPRGDLGLARLARGRRVRGRRQRFRVGGLDRPERAARRLPARQYGPGGARAARRRRPRSANSRAGSTRTRGSTCRCAASASSTRTSRASWSR